MNVIKSFAKRLGIDGAIAFTSGARIVQGFTGVGSIFFISTFLTGVEQGFYYTFGSLLALQVFFELGLTGIMTQYVAHEASHLTLDSDGNYSGNDYFKSRLASLLIFCLKWYSALCIIVFLFLIIFGNIYFAHYGDTQSEGVEWELPWLLVVIASSMQLFVSPFTAILKGLGFVKEMSKITFWGQIIIPLFTWGGLALGVKLYVLGISNVLSILIWFVFAYRDGLLTILKKLLIVEVTDRVNYLKEIFPYQWRISLSWISGYFIFQLFNPVLFATEGPTVAGQMGMTLQALNAINALSLSWMNTKVPLYSNYIARKEYVQLDTLFNKTLRQMTFVCASLLIMFFGVIVLLKVTNFSLNGSILADRFLDYIPMILMMIPIFLNQFIGSWATYLRCHKQEPYLINSVVGGILCLLSTFFLGRAFGLYGITIGYCCIQILMFPWGYNIYRTKKAEWHNNK